MSFDEIAEEVLRDKRDITLVEFITYLQKNKLNVVTKVVKSQKASGVIYVPARYKGKRVILIVQDEKTI